ncbi:M28 family peptidase [Pedobacter boryungensis]|uniref:M28 family peptidase n=1 Tax=Pedobacter boryungensis TaxID=869962 RepID=A0ABX2DFF2_9SPHI|nr:M28 family peptidase [Pedobacter boryungensis]NQX32685.1 M28 family peptidase [Pedobacter boryungensis]
MKKQFLYTGLALFLSLSAAAQKDPVAVKFSESINKNRAYSHLSILASDEYEGRETGKKGAWMAAEYIKKQFKSFGLVGPVKDGTDPYFQKVGLVTNDVSGATLSINGKARQLYKDFVIPSNSVSNTGLDLNASEVIFAGYGMTKEGGYNDFDGINAEGKVIMIFSTGDPTVKPGDSVPTGRAAMMAARQRMTNLMKSKPKAILLIDMNFDKLPESSKIASTLGRIMLKKDAPATAAPQRATPIITLTISPATANEILKASNTTVEALSKKIMESGKPSSLTATTSLVASAKKSETPQRGENVLGFLEGSDPKLKNEILVITGHYDHIGLNPDPNAKDKVYNGADDDGSGTTGVLLMAEAFSKAKKAGKGPKRSILFMTVVGEEKGLLGSEWYSEHPVFPLANTIADLNTDMIGRIGEEYLGKADSANYIYSVGSSMLSTELGQIQEKINNTYTKMKLDFKYDDPKDPERIYYRSDHYNFAKNNIPIIFFYDGMLGKDYHGLGDEVSKINFDLLAKRAHLTYYIGWELANRPNRPVVDKNQNGTPKTTN